MTRTRSSILAQAAAVDRNGRKTTHEADGSAATKARWIIHKASPAAAGVPPCIARLPTQPRHSRWDHRCGGREYGPAHRTKLRQNSPKRWPHAAKSLI